MEIKKKAQLVGLLKKIEGQEFPELAVIDSLLNEIKTLEMMIPDTINISPIKRNIEDIRGQYASLSATLAAFDVEVSNIKQGIRARDQEGIVVSREVEANFKVLEEKIAELRKDLLSRLSNRGGGQANRNIQVGGVNVLTPWTDINFIAGSNVTIIATPNNTTHYTDITITGTATGVTLTPETPTGTVDGSNLTFTVTHTPVQLFTDGQYRVNVTDYTYSAGTIIMNALLAPAQSIISYYNAA